MTLAVFFIALGAPLLWALVNHTDKYLIDKFFGSRVGGGVGGLMVFSTFFSALLLPFIVWFSPSVFDITLKGAFILILAGVLNALAILAYLYALNEEETTVVVPFMQIVPIFSFLFGYYLLGEVITTIQFIGGLIIIFGSSFLALGGIHKGQKLYFKSRVVLLMVLYSIGFGLYGTLFKFISLKEGFWSGAFWEAVGLVSAGFVLFCIPTYRRDFFKIFKSNSKTIIGINLFSEFFTILGNWLMTFASLMAKLVLVNLIAGFQPVFVLIFGILTTIFFPHVAKEDISKRAMYQKVLAILVILFGTYLVY